MFRRSPSSFLTVRGLAVSLHHYALLSCARHHTRVFPIVWFSCQETENWGFKSILNRLHMIVAVLPTPYQSVKYDCCFVLMYEVRTVHRFASISIQSSKCPRLAHIRLYFYSAVKVMLYLGEPTLNVFRYGLLAYFGYTCTCTVPVSHVRGDYIC